MWHGGTFELLQTSVSEGKDGNPVIQGGVFLALNFGISNSKSSSVQLVGSLISHLTGSNFFNRSMFLSNLSIVSPDLDILGLRGSALDARNGRGRQIRSGEEMNGEETDNYKGLTEQIKRFYTSAPRDFTIIDRSRRNSVVIARDGFNKLYMFCPSLSHQSCGMYSFICVEQSTMLKPVISSPGDVWTGRQHLHNPKH
ncbi:hypothetical protein P3X46_008229 [Hevea brasiliensis]|uniref:Uncharacterized protein n=1 Tax=Hevea brasiliensis TaxID=3981 RepID=A0ABQ9MM44_HEVBR|nr:hypothetical protein P3X46_008229 [Hevea brasiliensis]